MESDLSLFHEQSLSTGKKSEEQGKETRWLQASSTHSEGGWMSRSIRIMTPGGGSWGHMHSPIPASERLARILFLGFRKQRRWLGIMKTAF